MEFTDEKGNPLKPTVVTLDEIINKPSWGEDDIALLIENEHMLDDETKEKLGLIEIKPATPEEVEAQTKELKKKKTTQTKVAKDKQ